MQNNASDFFKSRRYHEFQDRKWLNQLIIKYINVLLMKNTRWPQFLAFCIFCDRKFDWNIDKYYSYMFYFIIPYRPCPWKWVCCKSSMCMPSSVQGLSLGSVGPPCCPWWRREHWPSLPQLNLSSWLHSMSLFSELHNYKRRRMSRSYRCSWCCFLDFWLQCLILTTIK